MPYSEQDLTTMALTVWAEARGEKPQGQIAVAHVIRNRWLNPRWWSRQKGDGIDDDTISAVCRDAYQFSCWNPNDPNRVKLEDPKTQGRADYIDILAICELVLEGRYPDPTNTADHYCTTKIINHVRWAKGRNPCAVIGRHSFFRIEL